MNKLKNTVILSLLSIFAFATDGGGHGSDWDVPDETPIDNYVYVLLAVAVMMIAYVAYNKRQAKTA